MNLDLIIKGMRPKTLAAAIVPPVCAYTLYYSEYKTSAFIYLFLCLLLALFIQIATNFYNDAIDYLKGADDNRVGPERISGKDKLDHKKVFILGHLFIVLALLVGIPLVIKGGIYLFILGIVSLFLAYGYTGGPFPLAYLGLGELFVFLFFGLVATCGSYFVYADGINLNSLVLGTQIGFLSSVLIAINNLRDKETDILVNKKTLATKLTKSRFLILIDCFLFIPYLLLLYFIIFVDLKYFFPLFSVSLAYKLRSEIRNNVDPKELNLCLALAGKHLVLFSFLFCVASLCR